MWKLARVVLSSLGIVKGERNKAKYDGVDEEVVGGGVGVSWWKLAASLVNIYATW